MVWEHSVPTERGDRMSRCLAALPFYTLSTYRYHTQYFYASTVTVHSTSTPVPLLYTVLLRLYRYCTQYSYPRTVTVRPNAGNSRGTTTVPAYRYAAAASLRPNAGNPAGPLL